MLIAAAVLAAVSVLAPVCLAHPDIEVRIAAVTKQIDARPDDASLYMRRGNLHREHRDWEKALADLDRAAELAPNLADLHLARGRLWFDAGQFAEARGELDRFVSLRPGHAIGLIARGRLLRAMGEQAAAGEDYDRAIRAADRPGPQLFLDRARAFAEAGEFERALSGLDEAATRLGPVLSLESYAIELEATRHRYDAALARLGRMRERLPKERFLQRRGVLLERAGRPDDARASYQEALAQVHTLPPRRRDTKPFVTLEAELAAAVERLENPLSNR